MWGRGERTGGGAQFEGWDDVQARGDAAGAGVRVGRRVIG